MSRTVRALAALALAVLFLAGPVAAATPVSGEGSSWWGSAWQWLVEMLLPEGERPDPVPNDDAGGGIDPDGLKVSGVCLEPREGRPAVR